MLEDIERLWPAVIEFQKTSRWCPHALAFAKEERKAVRVLLTTLKLLHIITEILSHAEAVTLATSQFAYSKGILGKMYALIRATKAAMVCPVLEFVKAESLVKKGENDEPILYNPLAWWYHQHSAEHERNGMTQMHAHVDIERAFSFAGSIVSKHQHSLAPCTVHATASLSAYSRAGLMRPGILQLPVQRSVQAKAQATDKAKAQE
ncbi:hypothetical protein BDV93DRAFT_559039 [Ceratobasidium sp. AG-I]|nr:hypothetical protein BDV93DRAFT_559039 [Ceratobasidium sp. AG-I]